MIAVADQVMKACAIQRTLLSEELRCWSSQSFLSARDHERSSSSLSECPAVHLFWGFEMTQPATVFATDRWWWIQCKESQNMLGLVCLADLLACRRLPMLGSFTRRYLCSHDNGSTIFHRLWYASILGEGRMLFLRMGVGFALSGLEQPAWNNLYD